MTTAERIKLIKQVGEEIITEADLTKLLESGEELIAYDGFEPSGKIHIGQGLVRAINVNKMTQAGVKFKMWVADWHALANNKMGGDLVKIQTVGKYFIEVWKSCGMDLSRVEFYWASELLKDSNYWKLVLQIAKTNTLRRFIRTAEIMGREESFDLTAAQIIYPCMQIADIFTLQAKITQLGLDQRKVNMLAREIGEQLGFWKPVVVSHHMLLGLKPPPAKDLDKTQRAMELKMSKSKPDSAIFMTDTVEEVNRKIIKAYCPPQEIEGNPILEYFRYIIFEKHPTVKIQRPVKFGSEQSFSTYKELEQAYRDGKTHPEDLKNAAAGYINQLLEPTRLYFQENSEARELKEKVDRFSATR